MNLTFKINLFSFIDVIGSLHISIWDPRFTRIGNLDIFPNGTEETVTLCPQASGREYFVVLTGTPNIHYTAEITDKLTEISLNAPVSFQASKTVTLFSFQPTFGLTQKQLDITVSSQSDAVAYLKVSRICKQAKNTKCLDYSGSYLRLTFNKKGRITLSRASRPSLDSSGFTYIGIALKDQSNENPTKSVKLTLASSFDYNYSGPLIFLICVSLFGGIGISLWALLCFRDAYILPQDLLEVQGDQRRAPFTFLGFFSDMRTVFVGHWVARRPKTFSYTTCIVGFALMIGAFQFVFGAWSSMIESGDRDRCYYNDFCYRVSGYDIPFNLMISNLVYMIHGLILACSLWVIEARLFANCYRLACDRPCEPPLRVGQVQCLCIDAHLANISVPLYQRRIAEAYKRKYSFSIGYSLAWALIFEGCFSTVYHFCPKQLTFQFDSAFMFVISGLIVVSLYNGISFKECAVHDFQLPVHSNNFFLFFIIPLFIFNYFGSLYSSDEITSGVTMFIICVAVYYLILIIWAVTKLFGSSSLSGVEPSAREGNGRSEAIQRGCRNPDVITKRVLLIIVVIAVAIIVPLKFGFRKIFQAYSYLVVFSPLCWQF